MDAIYFEKDGRKNLVASTSDQKYIMTDQQLDIALNEAGTLEFSLPVTSPALTEISYLNGEVTFERAGIELFRGELHGNTENMLRTGTFKANGALSYLEGLQMDPYEYAGSVEGYFTMLLNHYNDRASEWRKIQPGHVTVEDANDYIVRSNSGRVNYLKLLQEKLVDRLGGYLWLRVENGIKYLDYLAEINMPAGQDVKYGQNIVDIEQGIEYQDVYTVLIPEGKEDEDTGKKLSVESVNNGSPYVINQAALAVYGRRETVVSFPDVTVAENLLTKAQKALASYANPVKNVRVKAVDMAMWTDAECFRLGQSVYTKSEYHDIEDVYILSKMQIRSLKPEAEVLELGDLRRTYTQIINKKVNSVDDDLQELKDRFNQQDITVDSAKTITLTADTYVFKYDSAGSLTGATEANLLARAQNVTIDRWQYKNDSGTWVDYPDTEDNSSIKGNALKVKPNHPVFFGDAAQIKILSGQEDIFDTLTITKLRDGSDGDGIGGLSVILGNEAQTIACDSSGAVLEEVTVEIPFAGYVGTNQVPCECTVGTLPAGVTLSRNQASAAGSEGQVWLRFAKGATLGGKPNGTIPLTFTLSERKVQKQFSWSKSCTGDKGDDGVPGRTYILESDVQIVKKGANDVLSPKSITFSAYYRDGDAAARTAYAGRFKIYESTTDTSTWSLKYTSSSNQSSKTHTISSSSVKYIKCILYAAGGTTTEITSIIVNVIEDAEGAVDEIDKMLTQKEIFNRLTNNGEAQGIYYDESTGDLYINATYIVSGILASIGGESWINLEDGTFKLKNGLLDSVNILGSINIKSVYGLVFKLISAYQSAGSSPLSVLIDPDRVIDGGLWFKNIETFFENEVDFSGSTYFSNLATHTSPIIPKAGSYVHTAKGTSGTAGYVKIAQIKVNKEYVNAPIAFRIFQRGIDETTLYIRFANENNSDPALDKFTYIGNPQVYLVKSATSTWDLYIKKSEGYDSICVSQYHNSAYNDAGMDITWTDVHSNSLPSGFVSATLHISNDSDWITISSFLNSFAQASTSWTSTCKYRKIGNHVYVKGCVKAPSSWANSASYMFQLPAGYRPATRKYSLNPMTGAQLARIYADTNGYVSLEWTKKLSDGSNVSGSLDWIQIDIDFLVD